MRRREIFPLLVFLVSRIIQQARAGRRSGNHVCQNTRSHQPKNRYQSMLSRGPKRPFLKELMFGLLISLCSLMRVECFHDSCMSGAACQQDYPAGWNGASEWNTCQPGGTDRRTRTGIQTTRCRGRFLSAGFTSRLQGNGCMESCGPEGM